MKQLRHKEDSHLALGHIPSKWQSQSWDPNPGGLTPEPKLLFHTCSFSYLLPFIIDPRLQAHLLSDHCPGLLLTWSKEAISDT